MSLVTRLLQTLSVSVVTYGLYKLVRLIYAHFTCPLRHVPGPKCHSWLYGHFNATWKARRNGQRTPQQKWTQEFGYTFKYREIFSIPILYTTDLKAVAHVITNTYIWQKPEAVRYHLSRIAGTGLLTAEGDVHRMQRKAINPAFGSICVREYQGIFMDKAHQLRDIWMEHIMDNGGVSRIDALSWLGKTTLDIIGLAGFGYNFDSLNEKCMQGSLHAAFCSIFHLVKRQTVIPLIKAWMPIFRSLPEDDDAELNLIKRILGRVADELVNARKAVADGKNMHMARDVLSFCFRSHTSMGLQPNQKMAEEDILSQIPTFIVAGHETISTGTGWILFSLCNDKRVQEKLREELLAVPIDNPTMDELNALPYLDMVVREGLRIHTPIPTTMREAARDDVLPLDKPFTDTKGEVHDCIRVRKGQLIEVHIVAINTDKSIWGEDADEFKPERWQSIPEATSGIPGIWSNTFSFLGGPRGCIGYRFAVAEIKALLFTLLRAFEFELAVPARNIGKKAVITQRPVVFMNGSKTTELPLLIRPVVRP